MATFTPLGPDEARTLCEAMDVYDFIDVCGISAGSVNSNYWITTKSRRLFLRIYEEQNASTVGFEWQLLEQLEQDGFPAPRRLRAPRGEPLLFRGKPVAFFEELMGTESCQAGVTAARARAVGNALARAHIALAPCGDATRTSRFGAAALRERLSRIALEGDVRVAGEVDRLRAALERAERELTAHLPSGVIHGDLFRDNVMWQGDRLVAVIDWESASHGTLIYDLAVALLAWCYGGAFEATLCVALVEGYQSVRQLAPEEQAALGSAMRFGAVRFSITRITDFYMRGRSPERVYKEYSRFLDRLSALERMGDAGLLRLCGL